MTSADRISRFRHEWDGLRGRIPGLRWIETWGISVVSLGLGLLTLMFFRRGLEYFPWFVGYLLLLWVAGVLLLDARRTLSARGPRLVARVVDYTVQSMLHGVFLFLLPVYYASTTLWSGNLAMLLLLAAAALLTSIDPWYRSIHRRAGWLEAVLFWLGLFASLTVAFPLVRVRSEWSLALSAAASVLALLPSARRRLQAGWGEAAAVTVVAAGLVSLAAWSARSVIPPVPLQLARATFAQTVVRLEPVRPVTEVSASEVAAWGGLTAFTAVVAPAGLRQPVLHVWKRNGVPAGTIRLSPVRGGVPAGFRTYSRKGELGPDPAGRWEVDVVTSFGQLIGRVRLTVRP